MDDVIVYGLKSMERVSHKLNKCMFKKTELSCLGHIVDAQGVRADPEKVCAICELQDPNNVTELRRALGLNYMGKYIPNLAGSSV